MSDLHTLQKTKILQGLSLIQLEAMLETHPIFTYQQGEIIFEENSHGREMYVVLEGEVAVKVDPAKLGTIEKGSTELRTIRTFGPGESFGEMEVIGRHPREAAVVATQANTKLMLIPPQIFDNVLQAQIILSNITQDLSDKVRGTNKRVIETMLAGYYLTVLVEELATDTYECSPITPLEKLVVIREVENFILSGPDCLLTPIPEKETIALSFFAEPHILQKLVGSGAPSGAIIFSALFSIIKSGRISSRIDASPFQYEIEPETDRRVGTLWVEKMVGDRPERFTLEWQIKGASYNEQKGITNAHLFLSIYTDEASSIHARAKQIVDTIDMPVQRHIYQTLPPDGVDKTKFRAIIIHHRSHETARSLQTIRDLGYQIDTFIGIPYGDVNWDTIVMLNHASGHNYMSLRQINHPTAPMQYEFDFRQSSYLDTQAERDLMAIYADPAVRGDYLSAMQALAEYRLVSALQECCEQDERLIIYEDGAYLAAKIYEIYKNPAHPRHDLVRTAVAEGVIVGVVEVTVAGERKNLQIIEENKGQALLPVLSSARTNIKAVFEAVGVSEAVIHATSTSLGRLGLPTFQTRRVAVIGGNGAIGTRLIEQLTMLHNSTTNVFAVDITNRPFSMSLDSEALPYAATRLRYHALPRYVVNDDCFSVVLDISYNNQYGQPDYAAVRKTICNFLANGNSYQELAITNAYPLGEAELQQLWQEVEQQLNYTQVEVTPLADNVGAQYCLRNCTAHKTITLLSAPLILTFRDVSRLIRDGVNTIVGITGYPIFSAKNLDDFFARPIPSGQVDELTLTSGSSKDYEFRQALDVLNILLKLEVNAPASTTERLCWFATLYKEGMTFLRGEDFEAIQGLLAEPLSPERLQSFISAAPAVAQAMGLTPMRQRQWPDLIANYLTQKIRQYVSIRKEVRPDIGSIYHLTVNGQIKRLIMLADGLVVNFYARHEKGVKTEFIDPIVTMQVLSLIKLSTTRIEPGVYNMDTQLRPEDMTRFWAAIDDKCSPLTLK